MIWGCQWDAMCKWIKSNKIDIEERKSFAPSDITGNLGKGNRTKIAGNEANDKLCNIYDLLGNNSEWTLMDSSDFGLISRGDYWNSYPPISPSYYNNIYPDFSCEKGSTRATLCIP